MSNLYSKGYISSYPEKILKEALLGNKNIEATDLENRRLYVVLQHYLINYLEKNGKSKEVKKMLVKYYNDFINYPYLFVDSPLIKTEFMKRFMPEKIQIKIIEYRDRYYNDQECNVIYKKLRDNKALSNSEKNRLYAYLILQMNNSEQKYGKACEFCVKKILDTNKPIKDLNDMELKFYCQYIAIKAGEYDKVHPEVHIYSERPSNGGVHINNMVLINKNSTYRASLYEVTEVTCHETRHAIQYRDSKQKENQQAFEMARHQLFRKYLTTTDYDVYRMNYAYSGIELDAERFGYLKGPVFLERLGRADLAEKLREDKEDNFSKRNYYSFMKDKDGNNVPVDYFMIKYLDEIMLKHPEEMKNYKVLNNIYNEDGSRKSFVEIVNARINNNLENRKVFDNYLNYEIMKGKLDQVNLNEISDKLVFFHVIESFYKDQAMQFLDYYNDTDYGKYNPEQIEKTTIYTLNILEKIESYVDKNMDDLIKANNEDKISSQSFIYTFIYYFRNFILMNGNNEVIKNNPNIQKKLDIFLEKVNSVTKKFNEAYIKDQVKDLSSDELNSIIETPKGINMSLYDYLFDEVLPQLDGNQNLKIGDKEMRVSEIIRNYKQVLENTSKRR